MPRRLVTVLLPLLILLVSPDGAASQPVSGPDDVHAGQNGDDPVRVDSQTTESSKRKAGQLVRSQISLWYGHSTYPGAIIGDNSENQLELVGVRYHRLLIPTADQPPPSHTGPSLTYTADLVPLASARIAPDASPIPYFTPGLPRENNLTVHGIGVYPIGLRVKFGSSGRIHPFLAGHTGVLYFFEPLPDVRGKRLNFAFGVGAGLQTSLTSRTSLTVGYRFHHLSNGFRGSINPGFDANMLYLGVGRTL